MDGEGHVELEDIIEAMQAGHIMTIRPTQAFWYLVKPLEEILFTAFGAYNQKKRWAVLITVYRPDPNRWINCKMRKK